MDPFDYLYESKAEFEQSQRYVKTDEEIKKYEIDESMADTQRALYLLNKGYSEQKVSVVYCLPRLLRERSCQNEVVPKILAGLSSNASGPSPWDDFELKKCAAESFCKILKEGLLQEHPELLKQLTQTAAFVMKSDSIDLLKEWKSLFDMLIHKIPNQLVTQELAPVVIEMANIENDPEKREVAGDFFESLAKVYDSETFPQFILDKMMVLVQDDSWSIRQIMCEKLVTLSEILSLARFEETVLPEIRELYQDEMLEVRVAIFAATLKLVEILTKEIFVEELLPLVTRVFTTIPNERTLLIAPHMGHLIYNLRDIPVDEATRHSWLIQYKDLSQKLDAEERRMCAFDFMAVCIATGSKNFEAELYPLFLSLLRDEVAEVTATVAAFFHELVAVLQPELTRKLLKDPLFDLLQNPDLTVTRHIINHLSVIVLGFTTQEVTTPSSEKKDDDFFHNLWDQLDKLEEKIRLKPRLQLTFLNELEKFMIYFHHDDILDHIYPVIKSCCHQGISSQQEICCRLLCKCFKYIPCKDSRSDIIESLKTEFLESESARKRQFFINWFIIASDFFPRRWLNEHFSWHLYKMAKDPIALVRLTLTKALLTLKDCLPEDNFEASENFHSLVREMMEDTDAEVVYNAEEIHYGEMESENPERLATLREQDDRFEQEEQELDELEEKEILEKRKKEFDDLIDQNRVDYLGVPHTSIHSRKKSASVKMGSQRGPVVVPNTRISSNRASTLITSREKAMKFAGSLAASHALVSVPNFGTDPPRSSKGSRVRASSSNNSANHSSTSLSAAKATKSGKSSAGSYKLERKNSNLSKGSAGSPVIKSKAGSSKVVARHLDSGDWSEDLSRNRSNTTGLHATTPKPGSVRITSSKRHSIK